MIEQFTLELQRVRQAMAQALPQDQGDVSLAMGRILLDQKAKLLRPQLLLTGAWVVRSLHPSLAVRGANAEQSIIDAAAALELIHCASLFHDDVIDRATLRRGIPALHVQADVRRAILAGDYLFGRAIQLVADSFEPGLAKSAGQALVQLCRGEMLQDPSSLVQQVPSLRRYKRQAAGKTAVLMVLGFRGGAELQLNLLGLKDPIVTQALGRWAYALGMAFQINDDLMDYQEHGSSKGAFRDWEQGIWNYPLSAALLQADKLGQRQLLQFVRHYAGKAKGRSSWVRRRLVRLIEEFQGFALAQAEIRRYKAQADTILRPLGLPAQVQQVVLDLQQRLIPQIP
jgi:geranylgeranyl pyrophosphate synthase